MTWVEECDFSHVDLKRLVPLVLHAVTESLREFPELNARVEDGELVLLDRYDLGVAVQTEQGLVVPVVHGADRLSLDELDAEVRRLAEAAQEGTLKPEELRGGTFTVTSAGKAAGLFVTPLINHPEVGDPRHPPDRGAPGRAGRRGRRPPDGERLGHVRPPRDRRQARRRVRARGDRAARELGDGLWRLASPRCGSSIDSIRGAVARPSIRETTRFSTTSASDGTFFTRKRSARSGRSSTSTLLTRRRPRSFRAMWASRLSIRRAGPERREVKKTSSGVRSGVASGICANNGREAPAVTVPAWVRGTGSA